MDRHAPSIRPKGPNAGTQRWRELLFLHWSVPVDVMRAVVPAKLELDLFDDRAWVGIVPFLMRDIAPSWWPNALAFNFLECNLRTYVHHADQPGVYFFSLEASSWLAVQAARTGWGLPYHHAEMSFAPHRFTTTRKSDGAHLEVEYEVGDQVESPLGSREHFFLERYYLFAEKRGRLVRGQVHHVPYPARRATLNACSESLIQAAGLQAPTVHPSSSTIPRAWMSRSFHQWSRSTLCSSRVARQRASPLRRSALQQSPESRRATRCPTRA